MLRENNDIETQDHNIDDEEYIFDDDNPNLQNTVSRKQSRTKEAFILHENGRTRFQYTCLEQANFISHNCLANEGEEDWSSKLD